MRCSFRPIVVLAALLLVAPAFSQGTVRTEVVPVPKAGAAANSDDAAQNDRPDPLPEIIRDLSRLPEAVRRTRERILEAARTGDLNRLAAVMRSNGTMPVFSFGGDSDPVEFWKSSYPDSDGIEALAILIDVLEAPFVHLDRGTPQEMYVWPYFYAIPLDRLTPEQKVELFRLVTGADWREMEQFGAYIFFRVGIAPDGVWHFFVAGD